MPFPRGNDVKAHIFLKLSAHYGFDSQHILSSLVFQCSLQAARQHFREHKKESCCAGKCMPLTYKNKTATLSFFMLLYAAIKEEKNMIVCFPDFFCLSMKTLNCTFITLTLQWSFAHTKCFFDNIFTHKLKTLHTYSKTLDRTLFMTHGCKIY